MPADIQQKNLLYDFYGDLLTDKQRVCFEMYYMEDLSLSEIGEQYGVTTQAVSDLLKRTGAILEHYESVLRLVEKYHRQQELADQIYGQLSTITGQADKVASVKRLLDAVLQ